MVRKFIDPLIYQPQLAQKIMQSLFKFQQSNNHQFD
jgi:hypothetical protein